MSKFIEEFYHGNIDPQELSTELSAKLKKKLSKLPGKEEQLTARLNGEEKELFLNYASAYNDFSISLLVTNILLILINSFYETEP